MALVRWDPIRDIERLEPFRDLERWDPSGKLRPYNDEWVVYLKECYLLMEVKELG